MTLFLVHYAEFLVLFIAMLSVIMPSVIMLNVISGLQELAWSVSNGFYP
jgi:hypothetical protein